jgi:alkanesulfonate monooxygenase SsuD/methylene tetrahydromethanopterin reductase-like flavin-dependent oxidoreductase (luciferase family)
MDVMTGQVSARWGWLSTRGICHHGVSMSAASRLSEGVEIIRRLWSEDRVTHRGRHWQFSDATIAPRPLQSPRPPIIVGGQVEAAIRRAAKIGDGWLLVPIPTLHQIAPQMALFKSARSASGLPPSEHICRLFEVGCAPDEDIAFRRTAPFLMEKYKSYFSWGLKGVTLDSSATPEAQLRGLAANRFAVGAPAQVADALVAQHRAGITHLAMRVSWPGMGQDDPRRHRAAGRQVLPEVRRRASLRRYRLTAKLAVWRQGGAISAGGPY